MVCVEVIGEVEYLYNSHSLVFIYYLLVLMEGNEVH